MYEKEIRNLILEIVTTIIIVVISIGIWNRICIMSRNNKQIAKMYEDTKLSILNVDNYENKIVKFCDKDNVSYSTIRVHNVSSNYNGIEFILKLPNDIEPIINYLIIDINNNYYNLNELIKSKDNDFYYIKLDQHKYNKYETKTFNIKILLNDDNNLKINYYNYEFTTNTL